MVPDAAHAGRHEVLGERVVVVIQDDAKRGATDETATWGATQTPPEKPHPEQPPRGESSAQWRWTLLGLALFALGMAISRYIATYIWKMPDGDVNEYFSYAQAFWTHQPLFHSLPVEYPPLSIVPFSLTVLPPISSGFHTVFGLWMAVIALLGYVWLARLGGQRSAIAYACYLLLGTAATLLARFDLVPALVTLGALLAAQRRRFTLAYVLLALGVLLKLYPIFLVPPVMIAHWQSLASAADRDMVAALLRRLRGRVAGAADHLAPILARIALGGGVFIVVVGAVFGLAYVLNPAGTISEFQFATYRPIQLESTPATLMWIGSHLGIPANFEKTYQSWNYVGQLGGILMPLSTVALVAGCLWAYWRQARGQLSLDRAFLATLCVVIVTNKLFSPQYIIWVIPFAALVEGLDFFWLAIALLTTLDFPVFYQLVPHFWLFNDHHKLFDVLMFDLLLRNGLFVYVALRALMRRGPALGIAGQLSRFASLLGYRRVRLVEHT